MKYCRFCKVDLMWCVCRPEGDERLQRSIVGELEAILSHSGVAAYLPAVVKERICRSVAVDLAEYVGQVRKDTVYAVETFLEEESIELWEMGQRIPIETIRRVLEVQ